MGEEGGGGGTYGCCWEGGVCEGGGEDCEEEEEEREHCCGVAWCRGDVLGVVVGEVAGVEWLKAKVSCLRTEVVAGRVCVRPSEAESQYP